MTDDETALAAAGWWRVGPKGERERYAVASARVVSAW